MIPLILDFDYKKQDAFLSIIAIGMENLSRGKINWT